MGLSLSLLLIFLLFCLMMAAVLAFCLRERRRVERLSGGSDGNATIDYSIASLSADLAPPSLASLASMASLNTPPRSPEDDAADERTLLAIFGSIIIGALLAIATGYLVFFRNWTV